MNTNNRIQMSIIGIVLILAACTDAALLPPLLPVEEDRVTPMLVDTLTPTSRPTKTTTPTLSVSNTSTPMTIEWTPVPTIAETQREDYLLDLIANYNECSLPCWWGIQPGVTEWEGVREILGPLGWLQDIKVIGEDGKYENFATVNQDNFPNLDFTFYSLGQDTIQYISVHANMTYEVGEKFHYPDFEKAWSRYSLAAILSEFGVPDQVSVYLQPGPSEPGSGWGYQIILIYEDSGIFAHYTFDKSISLDPRIDQYQICPQAEDMFLIDLFFKSLSDKKSFKEVMRDIDRAYLGQTKLLEDISDLSVEEFHALFTNGSVESCLVSDGANWP